ncbi:hypothetical protein GCM10011519_27480 [Marmoricola endophyticus]|uniref:Lipoprotein n=1 Tax=Marmoricola endophyticus TaxID=2040280 RepID=A0A917BQ97_9ACTN|nr:hypothetical protein [Marmoricola endophyticus]GGF51982.1 hypothetical protein GCM10011519_27480 [Marmoricola endophyticus]
MPHHLRFPLRRRVATAALVLLAPVAAGCGFDVQTDAAYQPAQGSNERVGQVDVLGAVVVSDAKGSGRLIATFVNRGGRPASLTGITGRNVSITGPSSIAIPSYNAGFTNLADSDEQPIVVSNADVDAGYYVRMRFSFSGSDAVTLNVPVVAADGPYAGLAPGQSESGTGSSAGDEVAATGSQGAFGGDAATDEDPVNSDGTSAEVGGQ